VVIAGICRFLSTPSCVCLLQDAAKRAEADAADAKATAEAKIAELTRARAELLSAQDQLAAITRALDAQQLQALLCRGLEVAAPAAVAGVVPDAAATGGVGSCSEGMAARLAAAQVMRREAEDHAAQLARKLAAAERALAELQQQQGESDAAANELGGQLSVTAAQLARSKAEAVAQRAAAEGGVLQMAEMGVQLQEVSRQLAAVQAERDALRAQLAAPQQQQQILLEQGGRGGLQGACRSPTGVVHA
jgi:chemotaxis protein MotB